MKSFSLCPLNLVFEGHVGRHLVEDAVTFILRPVSLVIAVTWNMLLLVRCCYFARMKKTAVTLFS